MAPSFKVRRSPRAPFSQCLAIHDLALILLALGGRAEPVLAWPMHQVYVEAQVNDMTNRPTNNQQGKGEEQ
jgi:hypothetical protein